MAKFALKDSSICLDRGQGSFWFDIGFPEAMRAKLSDPSRRCFSLMLYNGWIRFSIDPYNACRIVLVRAHLGALFLIKAKKYEWHLKLRLGPRWLFLNTFLHWRLKPGSKQSEWEVWG